MKTSAFTEAEIAGGMEEGGTDGLGFQVNARSVG
jgi:hypothetical protein